MLKWLRGREGKRIVVRSSDQAEPQTRHAETRSERIDFSGGVSRYFALQNKYRELYARYEDKGVSTALNPNDSEFDAGTSMQAYLAVGADAMRVIIGASTVTFRDPPKSILDFPSGSGRVTRHLQAFFPDAIVTCSDLYERHLDFCRNILGVETVMSKANPDEINFGRKFDLIFCGSLLTHLPQRTFSATLQLLSRSLTEKGLAIVTLHGRHSEFIQKHKPGGWEYMSDEQCGNMGSEAEEAGFSFRDYNASVTTALFCKQETYGVSFSRPRFTMSLIEKDYGVRILGYTERGWDNHQDVLVFGRPGVDEKSLGY